LPALARAVELEVNSGRHERLFVRVLGPRQNALFYTLPPEWNQFDVDALAPGGTGGGAGGNGANGGADSWAAARARDRNANAVLEVASLRLWDGTIIQVGKSTESRDELLANFREVTGFVSLAVMLIGVAGGIALTRSTLRPIHHLIDVVRGIIQTGRTETRVPVPVVGGPAVPNVFGQRHRADAIDELSTLFNVMLDRITTLIAAMRDALDNVAPDLRTPMTRLRGMAERALESGSPEQQREALVSCLEESDRILSMLNTLMDISEAETGTLRLQIEEVPLRGLIAEVVDLYEEVAEDKGITVRVAPATPGEAAARDDIIVSGDRDRLRQVFANLLDTALKYTPAGGQVTITLERRDDARAAVVVRDTGIGITPEDLPRIWDRLYRGDRSRAERGLGLGLSLVRAYVRAHGGSVTAESTPGQGSTFTVLLDRRANP
jgi:signal transduction histidine kinase